MVPLFDGNICAFIVSKVVENENMVLDKAKFNVRIVKWSNKHNMSGKLYDNDQPFVKWKTKEKIPHNVKLFVECKTKEKIPYQSQ